jgi:rhamnose utilization protein RhaD (predicted bifunctional aldolase and dehydrogenase)/NAD(P)-dependent dehydrogenase (short-subunit alcohol dehydrogenase family)
MESRWSEQEAEAVVARYLGKSCNRDLALRAYSARLVGADPTLVLHGGGNCSVKTLLSDDLGREIQVLCVKASGRDMATLEPADLPALALKEVRELRALDFLKEDALANAFRIRMLDATAPNPSVEALLHAFLPHKYLDHSHATAILSLVNLSPSASEKVCGELFAGRLAVVPYVMSGLGLAKLAAEAYERNPQIEGLLLLQHGLVTFGESARESYERHIQAVDTALTFVRTRRYWSTLSSIPPTESVHYSEIAPVLRGALNSEKRHYIFTLRNRRSMRDFVDSPQLVAHSERGVATPDHVIRTKRVPLLLNVAGIASDGLAQRVKSAVEEYRQGYQAYVERNRHRKDSAVEPLDPDPRVVLVPGLGMITLGESVKEAEIAADVYEQTIEVMQNAEAIDSYHPPSEEAAFDFEYWSMEQAKLTKTPAGPLKGRVVYITGAASGIGAAVARAFVREGCAAYLVDRDGAPLEALAAELGCACQVVDVTDEAAVAMSVDRAVRKFGGLDGAVSNAGNAEQSPIDTCPASVLQKSIQLNLLAHQWVSSSITRVLRLQGTGGFLLFNASKAAFNPGAGFGPYAIAKAGLVALMKQYALELGRYGIRSNAVNADRIRTGLFSLKLIEERAKARGIEADAYFKANLLGREVTADDVAQAFLALALAESTTGCVITVDGGNIAASPR